MGRFILVWLFLSAACEGENRWYESRSGPIELLSDAPQQKPLATLGEAEQLRFVLGRLLGIEDLKATVAAARQLPGANGKVATMGYCLGGRLAFMMAEQSDADANISYYGVGLDGLLGDLPKVTKPLLIYIADKDAFFPPEGRAAVVAATQGHQHAVSHVYPDADHAFARVNGIHWDGRSATIANGRSAELLAAVLG